MSEGGTRDPGLQPERTALAWRRTLLTVVVTDILILRGWLTSLAREDRGTGSGAVVLDHSAHTVGLGICAMLACALTVVLAGCAVVRIRLLHAGHRLDPDDLAPPAWLTGLSAGAVVALALAAMAAIFMGLPAGL